ncbi:hypothetical protein [Fuerstiella marisgermanici]|uniref:Uncharacterized protein n=1 Tax=Fuerstiella marisgermanici TaxID=1891926 RepID=A0A1P8WGM6_9PLAN|nr:hypothetical protein [Fuerstiella marisgermanici]APZ93192.1 hypothetical protein Fuma_02809 [Fuerstiella marisgermanici]
MAKFLNRREFASGITLGLAAMKCPLESCADEQKPELPPTWLVEHGINALARAA